MSLLGQKSLKNVDMVEKQHQVSGSVQPIDLRWLIRQVKAEQYLVTMDGTGVEKSRQFPGQLGRSAEMKGPEMGPEPAATPDDQGLHAPEQGVANWRRRHLGD